MDSRVRRRAERAALAVVDGEEIDWHALDRTAPGEAFFSNLRVVADLAARSRAAGGSPPSAPSPQRPMGLGLRIIVALCLAQVLGALLGVAFGSGDGHPVPPPWPIASSSAFCLAAIWLVVGGRQDARASHLAGFFLANASASALRFVERLPPILPPPVAELARLLAMCTPEAFMPLFLWLFVRDFPRIVRWGRYEVVLRVGTRIAAALGLLLFAANLGAGLRYPGEAARDPLLGLMTRSHASGAHWVSLFVVCLPALVVALARARDAKPLERRRVALFLAALGLGIAPMLVDVILDYTTASYSSFKDQPGVRTAVAGFLYLALLTVPFTTAYSVLANQVLSVRLAARRLGSSRLVARGLVAVSALPVGLFGLHVYDHREASLASLLATPAGRILALAAVGGLGLLLVRERVQQSIAPSAARQMAQWREVLADLAPKVRAASRTSELQAELAAQFRRVLNVEDVFLLRHDAERGFVPWAAGGRALPRPSALFTLVRADAGHLLVDPQDPRSLFRLLPTHDRQWVSDSGASCLMPIVAPDLQRAMLGLLVIGPRIDDLPFSRDDVLFILAMAAALAPALERHHLHPDVLGDDLERERAAQECRVCGALWPWSASTCRCGGPLGQALVPRILNGKFELCRVLGRGAMGVVYEARDLVLDRVVALKAMPWASPDVGSRLRREARAMASVVHPHLALILGAESWKGVPVLVVEHLAGGTLDARLGGTWPCAEALALGVDVADALEAMHARGLAHRDVKPSNIGFTADGTVRLLDFGLVRLREESLADSGERPPWRSGPELWSLGGSSRDRVGGTPLYLPPEAFEGRDPGTAQDLWGLAAVIYELIAGQHPHSSVRMSEPFSAWWIAPIPDIRRIRVDCPPQVAEWLQRALHPDPSERPSSARAVRQQLAALDG